MKFLQVLCSVAVVSCFYLFFSEDNAAAMMSKGSNGSEVEHMQSILEKLDYFHTTPTGYYGPITERAVSDFQADFGLGVDGVAGTNTLNMISNIEMMAHVVHGESRGEAYEGKVAVASVILNRVQSSSFPSSTYGVIYQQNAFTALNDGQYWLAPSSSAYRAAKDAYLGWDPSEGATYYYNPSGVTDEWIYTRDVIKQIGQHYYAR
ncbi:cell wall hydrolase [Pseudalkalibacillus hwajinpoensis]|uniref:cell wall hydrolase n=1 Tax=Guptibacillus hwajinpoensis TaxID=208199 RepID=UPI00325B9EBA